MTAVRVGLPRTLTYHEWGEFFTTAVESLGGEVVLSRATSPRAPSGAGDCPTDEPCLPITLAFSHVAELAARDDVDFVVLPVVAREGAAWCCPKLLGVADMVRHGLRLAPDRLLGVAIEEPGDVARVSRGLRALASRLGVRDSRRIRAAAEAAVRAWQRIRAGSLQAAPQGPADAAVIGHAYLLQEPASMGLVGWMQKRGRVLLECHVSPEATARELASVREGERLWPAEARMLGAGLSAMRSGAAMRLLYVGAFGCGPASVVEPMLAAEAGRLHIPYLALALDEHSAEAGLMTRLEAFMETAPAPVSAVAPPSAVALATRTGVHVAGRPELVGFPSMGRLDAVVRRTLGALGVTTLAPPAITEECLELGREASPEFACFPYVATLGQLRLLAREGATLALMPGGKGKCRLGWYGDMQRQALRELGVGMELVTFDAPTPLREKWSGFAGAMRRVTGGASWGKVLREFALGVQILRGLDEADALAAELRGSESRRGAGDEILARCERLLPAAGGFSEVAAVMREVRAAARETPRSAEPPLRIRLTGEIWVLLEPQATRGLEHWLGTREWPRVHAMRAQSTSAWFDAHVLNLPSARRREAEVAAAGARWLGTHVGGHGQVTVGEVARASAEGIDGVIHVFPFTCMPEIVAQNVALRVAEEERVPMLTYIVSEQTGEAGIATRLEAFLELLAERRAARS